MTIPSNYNYNKPIDLLNLERLPETEAELTEGTYNPEFIMNLNRQLNEQSERIEFMILDIITHPDHQAIEYKDIMHWKERAAYLRRMGQLKAARDLEKAEAKALKDAHDADDDEEFMAGFNDFLANEFDQA